MSPPAVQTATVEHAASTLTARQRIRLIYNPTAGGARRKRFDAVVRLLDREGCSLDLQTTGGPGDAERFAQDLDPGDVDLVLAAGGDGTINEVINGLAGSGVPLAILPLGTANVMALELGLPLDPSAIADAVLNGPLRSVCLGRAACAEHARYFSLMAGAGFDAHVVAGVNLRLKRLIGKGAYVVEMVRQLARFPFPEYRVLIDGEEDRAASVVVANARYYAGRYILAPDASLEEPLLQVCLFERGTRLDTVRYAIALDRGTLRSLPSFRLRPARKVEIFGPPGDPLQADGDRIGSLPVEITVVPDALRLIGAAGADSRR